MTFLSKGPSMPRLSISMVIIADSAGFNVLASVFGSMQPQDAIRRRIDMLSEPLFVIFFSHLIRWPTRWLPIFTEYRYASPGFAFLADAATLIDITTASPTWSNRIVVLPILYGGL